MMIMMMMTDVQPGVLSFETVEDYDQLYSPTSVVDSIQGNKKREKEINSLHSSTKKS